MVRRQPGKDQGRRDSKGPKQGELGTFGEEGQRHVGGGQRGRKGGPQGHPAGMLG